MLVVPLSAMSEADTQLECLLTQRTFRSFGQLHNFGQWRLRFRAVLVIPSRRPWYILGEQFSSLLSWPLRSPFDSMGLLTQ